MFRKSIPIALALSFGAFACSKGGDAINGPPDTGTITPPGEDASVVIHEDAGTMVLEFPESSKAAVRFKRNEKIRNDFAAALGLAPGVLCKEFGQYSCTDLVHTIALGGVEPYELGIREGLEFSTVTTPMAVERVALAGCEQRVTQDFASPAAGVIFGDLGVNADGAIPDLSAAGVNAAIDTLYKRALQRAPRDTEIEHLKQLYRDVEATNEPGPARDWAILSCFSVLTTMEALFY